MNYHVDKQQEKQMLKSLVDRMPAEESEEFNKFGHMKIESGFENRVFIVYEPRGKRSGQEKLIEQREPKVLTTVRVIGLTTDLRYGAQALIRDEGTGAEMVVRYVPKKLFNYPIYISLPAEMSLKLSEFQKENGVQKLVTFALLVKSRNKSDFYTVGNTYMESPNKFKELFPAIAGNFSF